MYIEHRNQLIQNGITNEIQKKREYVLTIFSKVLDAVNPYNAVASHIEDTTIFLSDKTVDINQFDDIYVVAFGKGSIGMINAVCDLLPVKKGIAVTNQPNATVIHQNVETIVGGHPIPNEQSVLGAKKIQQLLKRCSKNDLVIVLISGGGSALLASPRIPLSDLQLTTKALLASGATIQEINTIRKHVSKVKGGQLVRSIPCQVISFIISDVVGDPLEFIASGPTVGDSTTYSDAFNILKKYELWDLIPDTTRQIIKRGEKGSIPETPFDHDPVFAHVSNYIVANNEKACETAVNQAKKLGFHPKLLSTSLTGEASDLGPELFKKSKQLFEQEEGNIFISGGEPTVTLKGNGKGGRNQELVLSMVRLLAGSESVFCSFGTDGVDGMSPAAGAIADGNTFSRAQAKNMSVNDFLELNDSFTFFDTLQDALITGPTGTNVMDIQILIM